MLLCHLSFITPCAFPVLFPYIESTSVELSSSSTTGEHRTILTSTYDDEEPETFHHIIDLPRTSPSKPRLADIATTQYVHRHS